MRITLELAMAVALLAGCSGDGRAAAVESIQEGEARVEQLLVESMAQLRPDDHEFDFDAIIPSRDCDDGRVFSTLSRGWDDVPLEEALPGLDAVGRFWAQRGFEVDDSRRNRPALQEMLATTPQGDTLLALVSVPDDAGIAKFTVRGETGCLEPTDDDPAG